jgi:sialic acid synthase SpsE
MEPAEFKQLVTECRRAAAAIGEVKYGPTAGESTHLRRSLWVVRDIANGEELKLRLQRGTRGQRSGVHPDTDLFGTTALNDIKAGTPLTSDLFA